jgi:hypothetical protein
MSPYLNGTHDSPYSPLEQTRSHFKALKESKTLSAGLTLPEYLEHASNVAFTTGSDEVLFPCPFQQKELISVLKAIEACWAACIADLRFGKQERMIEVQLERSARYLLGSYLFKIDGLAKGEPGVMEKLKDTDLNQAHSIPYRRSSTNVYATKRPGEYFHLHGSLDASTALNMLGMEAYRPDLTEYRDIVGAIKGAVEKFTVEELEEINAKHTQAGTTVNKREAFLKTAYVSVKNIQAGEADL